MRILSATLVLVLALSLIMPVAAYANEIIVTINGQRVDFADQEPIIMDGSTLVPLRGVFETLGFDVNFDNSTRTAILVGSQGSIYNNYEFRVPIGSSHFELNGQKFQLDVPAQIINGRTMLPMRPLLERVGINVDWNYATRTVIIESESPPYRLPGMTHEQIMDTLIGTWVVLETDMPGGYYFSSFTLNAPDIGDMHLGGDGEVVIGADRQRISWMINVYRDLLISFPDALTYNSIEDLNADSLTIFHNGFVIEFTEGLAPHFAPHRAVYTRVR